MRLARLKDMGLPELVLRSRQEATKWLEQWPLRRPNAAEERRPPGLPNALLGLEPHVFFAGASEEETPDLLRGRMPEEPRRILEAAEAALQEKFDLLGYRGLDFGHPIDWHYDPVSGRRAPRIHWSRISLFDSDQVGDVKVIWELNRHQWMVTLGQAYRLTGEERYVLAMARQVTAWFQQNPRGKGINWTSSLEVALRLISWCWTLRLVEGSPSLSAELRESLLEGIAVHAARVERYLSTYSSPNTHLTGEALGLVYAGVVLPGPAAARWLERGACILVEESGRHILEDGVYFEQATCYGRYTAEIYLHFLVLLAQRGISPPPAVAERLERLLDFLVAIRRPDGALPAIGDADGGWLLPLSPGRAPHDVRGVLATAAALLGRSDYAFAAGGPAPELLWLLGGEGLRTFDALAPQPPAGAGSRLFPVGGYTVMGGGGDAPGHQLVLDVGPLGCPKSGGHGHADLLSVQCSAFGEPYVVDPGTGTYSTTSPWRDFFRSTAAHSTVTVDGLPQAVPRGPFGWASRPRARLRRWVSTRSFDLADADHDGYQRLPNPVLHRRRVLFVKPRYFVVADDLMGHGQHRIEVRFQLAPRPVRALPPDWVFVEGPEGRGLLVRAFGREPLEVRVHEGEIDPIAGWVCPDYGQRRPAPQVVFSTYATLPLRILTLLWPAASPEPPAVEPLRSEGPGPTGLLFHESAETVVFGDDVVMIEQA